MEAVKRITTDDDHIYDKIGPKSAPCPLGQVLNLLAVMPSHAQEHDKCKEETDGTDTGFNNIL